MTFEELEAKIDKYMLLEDRGVVRLLAAFVIGNRLPLPPPWVFIVTSSSGGKTKLIQLLENIPGYFDVDDLTGNTLLSGAKNYEKSNSLLHKITADGFLVFRDFTTILSKNKEVMGQLMSQLRMVYDGKFVKHTGLGDEISYKPTKAPGLLAGVTTKIYTTNKEWADMGERMVMYHVDQPDNLELGMWILDDMQDEKATEADIRQSFAEYCASVNVPINRTELPNMDRETKLDLTAIANLAVVSRSPIERSEWKDEIILRHDKEMIGRLLKQLRTLAYAFILMNDGVTLLNKDKALLYKIALDSIPLGRLEIMRVLTKNALGGDVNQIAEQVGYPYDTVEKRVQDLNALGMLDLTVDRGMSKARKIWKLKPKFLSVVSKFEHIDSEHVELPPTEDDFPLDPFAQYNM